MWIRLPISYNTKKLLTHRRQLLKRTVDRYSEKLNRRRRCGIAYMYRRGVFWSLKITHHKFYPAMLYRVTLNHF